MDRGPTTAELPHGVRVEALSPHPDERGWLCELYRESDCAGPVPVQWNVIHSGAGVLRGVRVHVRNADSVVLVSGRAYVGMQDLRPGSPTDGSAVLLPLSVECPTRVTIPAGIAHGFYFPEPAILLVGLTHAWDPGDEYGCSWADPDLRIPWPVSAPVLSDKDGQRHSLAELRALLESWKTS